MKMPVDVSYRDVQKSDALEELIRSKLEKLEEVCDHIIGCHIAVEKAHSNPSHGSPYRVRLDLTVPPNYEIVVTQNPGEGVQYDSLESVIRDAFEAARRQLRDLNEQQHDRRKQHPEQAMAGIVTKLFPSQEYGFIRLLDGREIYFHRSSVLNEGYGRLNVGTGVQFFLSEGENGLQASTIRIVDKPGIRPPENRDEPNELGTPEGWQYVQN